MNVLLRKPEFSDAETLSEMICNDNILREDLGVKDDDYPTPDDFLQKLADWEDINNSETYAIVAGDQAVGTISLSRIDLINKSARIGYWVGSEFRKKGYCSKGFEELLRVAHIKGIKTVSAKIENDNNSSSRIWKKFKAKQEECERSKTEFTLQL